MYNVSMLKGQIKQLIKEKYFIAIKEQDDSGLRWIIFLFPHVLKARNTLGLTGLMQAVASRNHDAISILLQKGIDPNVMDQDGWTAKAWAILMNDLESLKRLREASILTHSLHNNICGMSMVGIGTIISDKTLSKQADMITFK